MIESVSFLLFELQRQNFRVLLFLLFLFNFDLWSLKVWSSVVMLFYLNIKFAKIKIQNIFLNNVSGDRFNVKTFIRIKLWFNFCGCWVILKLYEHPAQVPRWDATRWLPWSINLLKLPSQSEIMTSRPINKQAFHLGYKETLSLVINWEPWLK